MFGSEYHLSFDSLFNVLQTGHLKTLGTPKNSCIKVIENIKAVNDLNSKAWFSL